MSTDEMYDLKTIRNLILTKLPDNMKSNTEVLKTVDRLLTDNANEDFDEDELVTMFIDKFFTGLETIGVKEVADIDYAFACKYVSYKALGISTKRAFELTFPRKAQLAATRYQDGMYDDNLIKRGKAFERLTVVQKVMDIASVPIYIANSHILQKAVDKLEYLMDNSYSEKIQMESAIALLKELKTPEAITIEHKHGLAEDTESILDKFKKANALIASTTSNKLKDSGTTITDVDVIFKDNVSHTMETDDE